MLNQDYYVREKLRELEQQHLTHLSLQAAATPHRAPIISPVARGAGRLLRRLGEGLESWAGHEPEPMHLGRKPR